MKRMKTHIHKRTSKHAMKNPQLTDSTIVITGGAGFIGSHLANRLVDHNEVIVFDNLSTGDQTQLDSDVRVVEGDIRDEKLTQQTISGADVVFHEAAEVSVQRSVENPAQSNDINITGSLNVLEAARKADARVVVASSAAIYGTPTEVPLTEAEPTTPASPYGIQKLTLDHYTRVYHEQYGMDTIALRYFNVYGPGQTAGDYSGVISIFADQAASGDPITVEGDGSQTRDFIHIDDIVRANIAAATTENIGKAYNIGTGHEITIKELAETIHEVSGSKSEITHVEPRANEIPRSCADISKANEELGFEPQTELSEGLKTLL